MSAQLFSIVGGASPESRESAARVLRDFADAVDSGDCVEFVAMFVACNQFQYRRWATKLNAIALTTMALRDAIDDMKASD